MKCLACGNSNFRKPFTVTRHDPYRILVDDTAPFAKYHECLECEAMIFEGDYRVEQVYDSGGYYGVEGSPLDFLRKRFEQVVNLPPERSDNVARVTRIRDFLSTTVGFKDGAPSSLRVADVGAGMGVFLHRFIDSRWSGTAIEPDPCACQFIKEVQPSIEVLNGYSSSVVHNQKYHLITLNRVLEHVTSPQQLLLEEKSRLEEGGLIYIEVPDTLSFYHDGPNNEAFGYTHFIIFSPLTLATILRGTDIEIVHLNRVVEPSGKFTLYAFLRHRRDPQSL